MLSFTKIYGKFMGNPIGTLLIISAFAPFSIADNIKSLPSLFDFKAINKSFFLISLESIDIPRTSQFFLDSLPPTT